MSRRMALLVAGIVAALLIAIGFRVMRGAPAPARSDRSAPAPVAANPAPKSPPRAPAAARAPRPARETKPRAMAHTLPRSNVPLGEAVPILRQYAEQGDTDAALELSWRLSACTEHGLRGEQQAIDSLRESIESDKTDDHIDAAWRASRAKNAQRQIDERIAVRKACEALPADLRAGWLDWVDRAAQSGNTAAMLGYARMAVDKYDSVGAVLADPDGAILRRDKARAYLEEALQRGDAEALRDLANAYRSSTLPTIYPLDPEAAYAYAYAAMLAGIQRGHDLDDTLSETARSLDGTQLAAAEARGRKIYEACCSK